MTKLWYEEPAKQWEEALPIGNGRLGAMIFGGIKEEVLQLNEDSIWYGAPVDRNNPDARSHLEEVRKLILEGKIPEAERILTYAFSGTPASQRPYQTLGNLNIQFMNTDETNSYQRELDISQALHRVNYHLQQYPGCQITRETFASAKDQIIVMQFNSEANNLSFDVTLNRVIYYDRAYGFSKNSIVMDGNLGEGGNSFAVMVKAVTDNGTVETIGEHLLVRDAKSVTLYVTVMTSFYLYNAEKDNYITDKKYTGKKQIVLTDSLAAEADRIINSAIAIGYERLKDRHLQDYKELFDRVELQLEYNSELDRLPTNQRLARIDEDHPDNGLMMLYYQFGRYLMISGSRPGGLPLNLQGIWCKDYDSAWGSKYTININTEMNYWPAETCNLSECHEPLFDLIKRMVASGRETAEKMYGCKGFVAHHNTDIFGDTAPQDIYIPATYWVMGAAWLCTHIWEHYVFTGDNVFLRESYPIMKEAALFFTDFLIEEEGYLVTCPSVSPENTYILPSGVSGCVCAGASMDTQILRDLFNNCIKASRLLGNTDSDFALKLEELMNKFVPIQVGRHGQIMEWREDYEEAEPGHRHISQLYALYPSNQITVDQTPELAEAAKVTLRRRLASGGGHTGWSRAWIINMYARLWDEKSAYEHLIKILTKSTLNNLFDNHPPFQIDGNFGATAAMVEMLVQSDENRIVLLPALPKEWNTGSVKGICVRGGAELTLVWCDRSLKEVVLQPKRSFVTKLCYASQVKELNLIAGQMMIIKYE
ncbi:MAG: hypothetical protein K0S01_622 [Herbinix sp.]|jgi:alpha-L-fucosidase 2|nr:hypothetical protein [Herbinix sp.]